MSGAKLVVKQAFGINAVVKNCLSFSEDHHLAYACGNQVCVINTESKEQNFISGTNTYQHQSLGITAVVCSIGKKIIAVAEKVEPSAIVTFYDSHTLKKRKLLTYSELGSNEIRCLAFSDDGRYLITQGCGPEWNLVMWNVEKSIKVICSIKISLSDDAPVHQVSFCPWDPNVILVIGKSILRMFRFIEGQLRPITLTVRRDSANFISFCWLPDEILILGSDSGEILLIENLEYRGYIYPVNGSDNAEDVLSSIHCICPTPRGFAIGGNDGVLKLFERKDEIKERFELESLFKIPGDIGHVHAFAVNTSDETLVVGTDKHHLLCISLSNLKAMIEGGNKDTGPGFENILTPFHGPNAKGESAIIGIDIALWKQIVVTCGKDRTVRVWNPSDKKVELMKEFDEEPLSLTVHPSGVYIAVAFPDKIKILSLLLDDIFCCREIIARHCSYIKFSHGGQYIAAANGTHLQLYNTFTGLPCGTLRGHNNKIKSCVWMNFDSRIMTVGSEGVVYFWDLFPVNRRPEHFSGTVPISSGIGPSDGSKAFIATHDKLVKELNFVHIEGGLTGVAAAVAAGTITSLENGVKPSKDLELNSHISCMLYDEPRKMLLLGTSADDGPGTIITTLTSPQLSNAYEVNHLHNGTITAMCQSHDGNTLYSGDSNGNLIVSEFENAAFTALGKQNASKQREGIVSFEFVEEVVIHKTDLENRKAQISKLTLRVEELNHNNEYQLRLKEMEHKEKLKEITHKFTGQLQTEKLKYEELDSEKSSIEKEFSKKVKGLENKQIEELRTIEMKYKLKQNTEENRHKILVEETEDAHRRWNDENQTLVSSHQTYLQELTLEYEEKLLTEQRAQKNIHHDKEHLQVHFDSFKGDTENDGDREIAEMKIKYDGKLKSEEETGIELMAQHALLKKDLQIRSKDSNQQKEEIKRLKDKETRLYETIHSLEKDIQSHKKEIREREETITDKEKRIFDLKKKNQELEKFRFVLDYKIKELKLQIKPRETEINTMRKQIEEMNLELEQYHKSNLSLNLVIEELKLKLEGVKHELASQTSRYDLNVQLMERFKRDLQELWLQRHDQTLFKANVINMYQIYVQEDFSSGGGGSAKSKDIEDPQQVYNRDREQMERSLDSLRRALKTEAQAHKRDLGKMMRESVLLTKELNSLRKNARSMQLQKKAIDSQGEMGINTDLTELMELLGLQIKKAEQKAPGNKSGKNRDPNEPPAPPDMPMRRQVVNRTTALKTTAADGKRSGVNSRQDQWEAWREIQMQYEQMRGLEDHLTALCHACNIDPDQLIVGIDSNLAYI